MALRSAALLALCPLLLAAASPGQSVPSAPSDATTLVRRAVQHRLESAQHHHPMQYLIRRTDDRHDTTKAIIETKDGDVARVVAISQKPVSPETDRAELDRLDTLLQHPELQERRRKSEQKDTDRITHLLSLLPDAFLYTPDGIAPCSSGKCYKFSFVPNPHFNPPDIEANIFRGIAGELWIDQANERMVRLEGHFISDVDFGFGILGHLNKGGTVLLEQTDIGGDDWELTNLNIHVTGKYLLLKSFSYQVNESTSHYSPVAPGLSYRDAIQLLKQYAPTTTTYTP